MTTDKPATGWAMDAAKEVIAGFQTAWQDGVRPNHEAVTLVIQAAIDRETAAVVAERDEFLSQRNKALDGTLALEVDCNILTRERDEARASRDQAQGRYDELEEDAEGLEKLVDRLQPELDTARAAARELAHKARHDHDCQSRTDNIGLCSCGLDLILTKHAALLAEPEGGG